MGDGIVLGVVSGGAVMRIRRGVFCVGVFMGLGSGGIQTEAGCQAEGKKGGLEQGHVFSPVIIYAIDFRINFPAIGM